MIRGRMQARIRNNVSAHALFLMHDVVAEMKENAAENINMRIVEQYAKFILLVGLFI